MAGMKAETSRIFQYSDQVAKVIQHIDTLLETGRLVAGQRLVESDLAAELGLGRGPIREALRILAGDGIVELTRNRGARVRSFSSRQIIEMLQALAALLYAGMEAFVVSPRHAEGVQKLEQLVKDLSVQAKKLNGYGLLELMASYEQAIFEFAGNSYLVELHRRVHFHHYNRELVEALGISELLKLATMYKNVTNALRRKNAAKATSFIRDAVIAIDEALKGSKKR